MVLKCLKREGKISKDTTVNKIGEHLCLLGSVDGLSPSSAPKGQLVGKIAHSYAECFPRKFSDLHRVVL